MWPPTKAATSTLRITPATAFANSTCRAASSARLREPESEASAGMADLLQRRRFSIQRTSLRTRQAIFTSPTTTTIAFARSAPARASSQQLPAPQHEMTIVATVATVDPQRLRNSTILPASRSMQRAISTLPTRRINGSARSIRAESFQLSPAAGPTATAATRKRPRSSFLSMSL